MAPRIRFINSTDKRISFLMELEGRVVSVGECRIPCLEAKTILKVSQVKILSYIRRYESSWKIRALLDGMYCGLLIEPIDLLSYAMMVFSIETLDDGSVVLKAKGLRPPLKSSYMLQLRWGFGLCSKRHRERRMLEDIDGIQVKDEGMRSEMDYYALEYQQPFHINNMKVARLSTAIIRQEIKQFENAIVGYIAAEDMQGYDVKQSIEEQWKHFGSFEIHDLKPQFFLFDFRNEDDRRKALEHGQWFVYRRPLILKRWTSDLVLDPIFFAATLPVWVRFPDLRLEFSSSDSIAKIASVIGKPLFTDEPTALKKILQCARVCIEVDPMKELPKVVPIWCDDVHSFNQSVVYEWTPQLCTHCRSLLHESSACLRSANGPCLPNVDSCQQLWDEGKAFQSILPVVDGMHAAATIYDSGNEVNALTDEADAQADRNIPISTSGGNAIQESGDIISQEGTTKTELQSTTTMEHSEDLKNFSATARLLGSGRIASKRWLAYSKQKATSLIGTTNAWIAIIYDTSTPDTLI